ncbi:hypothetical protein DFH08DRAFT_856332, partial [Mycena albidolilacea]
MPQISIKQTEREGIRFCSPLRGYFVISELTANLQSRKRCVRESRSVGPHWTSLFLSFASFSTRMKASRDSVTKQALMSLCLTGNSWSSIVGCFRGLPSVFRRLQRNLHQEQYDPILVWNQFKFCPDVVELAEFSIILLGLVMNQASNERTFSDLKIKKTRLCNRLGIPKLEKMSKLGSSIRTDHLESGLAEARKPRDVHSKEKAATLLTVPRYADMIEGSDNEHDDPETQRQPKVIKSAAAWRMELANWKAAAAGDDSDNDLVPPPQGRQSNLFPRSLALLFGGDVRRPVERPRAAQFTREVLLMELLAAEESDEEPDDGA